MTINQYAKKLSKRKRKALNSVINSVEMWQRWRDENSFFSVHHLSEEKQEHFIQFFKAWYEEWYENTIDRKHLNVFNKGPV